MILIQIIGLLMKLNNIGGVCFMNEEIEIIETGIVFAVKVEVEAKVKKVTMYGNPTPEYKLLSLAGVDMRKVEDERDLTMEMVRAITRNIISKVKEYEEEIRKGNNRI